MSEEIEIDEFKFEDMPASCTWIIVGAPGSGKCLAPGTPVMMKNGSIKKVEDISTGDLIMGDDSQGRQILSTCRGTDKMYKIQQSYKNDYIVNEPHILVLINKENNNIEEISVKDFINLPKEKQLNYKGISIAVEYPPNPPITYDNSCLTLEVIPHRYKYASLNERTSFILSIIENSESKCRYNDKLVTIVVKCILFANDIVRLANSCGYRAYYKPQYDKTFKITFDGNETELYDNKLCYFSDIKVEYIGEGEYYGFQIDGNGRFLLGDLTITHNTSLIENMCYQRKHIYPVARIVVGTETGYKRFKDIFHPLYVSNYYEEEEEKSHVLRQRKCALENPSGYEGNYAINILDDATDDSRVFHSSLIKACVKLGSQHWNQLFIVGTQYAYDFPPVIRKSISYVAIGREPEQIERQKLFKNFGGICGTFKRFNELMDQLTGDFTFLIIKKRSQSNNLEDCLFFYKTCDPEKEYGNWKFGCKEYREWAEERYNKNYKEEIRI